MVEKIIEFCARNRLVVLLGVGFALVGSLVSIKKMKVDAIPDLSDPQVIVFTEWMGRSPTLVEDQVTVDPNRLRALRVKLNEGMDAIRQSNNDVGGRIIELSGREYYVRGRGYIHDLGAIEKIALRTSGPSGTPLLIKDVATVRFGPDI